MRQLLSSFPDMHVRLPYPVQFGDGDWITVITRATGTFTGQLPLPARPRRRRRGDLDVAGGRLDPRPAAPERGRWRLGGTAHPFWLMLLIFPNGWWRRLVKRGPLPRGGGRYASAACHGAPSVRLRRGDVH
jgi:hypothetical protein